MKLHYTGRLDDGRVFASSREQTPVELTVGQRSVMPDLEEALTQMEPGEERTVTVPAERAYGPRDPGLVIALDRNQFPEEIQPEVGQQLQVRQGDGEVSVVRIADVSDQRVTIDANHPLAGENLTFQVELLEISTPESS